ncbi:MAG: NADH-quinone oxidoreductase subunit N [Deltaproteobacteria bacterium]|nr:NADH-quinone oxidoreductase subunit N [Deltaproteobacteria bacterium]
MPQLPMTDLTLFLPEIALLSGALCCFIASVADRSYASVWALGTLSAIAALVCSCLTLTFQGEPFAPGIYRIDLFSQFLKLGISGGLWLVQMLSRDDSSLRRFGRLELPFFLLLSGVGMMILVSATELLTLYVGLELAAYGLYISVALRRSLAIAGEAAAKYLLFGAASSAITLYGISLIYGASGTTYLASVVVDGSSLLLLTGFLLMLAGFLFKLALFPFHFWAPDLYQAAPHPVAAFVATVSKIAAVGLLARALSLIGATDAPIGEVFAVLSVASMTLGNLAALRQTDLKRLIGYSAVAQAGYVFLGFEALSTRGVAAALFYALSYGVMSHLAFVVVCAVGRSDKDPSLSDLVGLHRRAPLTAFFLLVAMFSLAGIPPTAGFFGKWLLFAAALERGQYALVLIAAINSTVALYYYLQVVRAAYVTPLPADVERPAEPAVGSQLALKTAGWISSAAMLAIGIYPAPLFELAQRAAAVVLR